MTTPPDAMRLDKWLWCARFYKTRSLAVEEIGKGRVTVNGQAAKAARELRAGDTVALIGFGKFQVKARPARTGRNPATGHPIEIPESRKLHFKASAQKQA